MPRTVDDLWPALPYLEWQDTYDPVFANRCWRILAQIEAVLTRARCDFVGKASPTHFFYSHEVISHGFWPGGAPAPEPVFCADLAKWDRPALERLPRSGE